MTSDDAGRGVDLAQAALRAQALGDSSEVMRVINAASHGELAWACGWLIAAVEEAVLIAAKDNKRRARQILWAAASNRQDAVITQALAVLAETDREGK